jgi:hypothetical protein
MKPKQNRIIKGWFIIQVQYRNMKKGVWNYRWVDGLQIGRRNFSHMLHLDIVCDLFSQKCRIWITSQCLQKAGVHVACLRSCLCLLSQGIHPCPHVYEKLCLSFLLIPFSIHRWAIIHLCSQALWRTQMIC